MWVGSTCVWAIVAAVAHVMYAVMYADYIACSEEVSSLVYKGLGFCNYIAYAAGTCTPVWNVECFYLDFLLSCSDEYLWAALCV